MTVPDAGITQSANAALVGKEPLGVPPVQAHAAADWDVPGAFDMA